MGVVVVSRKEWDNMCYPAKLMAGGGIVGMDGYQLGVLIFPEKSDFCVGGLLKSGVP